jgi:predicted kinase
VSDEARLAIMCGLPKSGKTTYARGLQKAGWVRVCPDDIRRALHGRGHHEPAEPIVWANAELAVRALLLGGHAVVVDATHVTRERRAPWIRVARDLGVQIEAFVLETPPEVCHERNRASDDPVPEEVIDRMAGRREPVEEEGLVARVIDGGS